MEEVPPPTPKCKNASLVFVPTLRMHMPVKENRARCPLGERGWAGGYYSGGATSHKG